MRNSKMGCLKEVLNIRAEKFDIEYLPYKKLKLKEEEYKDIAKLRALQSLKVSDTEKVIIELFLTIYKSEINKVKRKLEFEIIKETLF